ncbi:MAG: hypothetical protein IKV93_03570 [Alphaproteobacteria bacterium]|nr:hypothetical protein [Alphaproteobacteria bacterium]
MQICIRRGAKQIGGTAVEFIASTGERMIVDIGQPLDCDCPSPELLPDIMGLTQKSDDINLMQERGVKVVDIHTSGHADIASLQKFARVIKAKKNCSNTYVLSGTIC